MFLNAYTLCAVLRVLHSTAHTLCALLRALHSTAHTLCALLRVLHPAPHTICAVLRVLHFVARSWTSSGLPSNKIRLWVELVVKRNKAWPSGAACPDGTELGVVFMLLVVSHCTDVFCVKVQSGGVYPTAGHEVPVGQYSFTFSLTSTVHRGG